MNLLDVVVVIGCVVLLLGAGFLLARRGGKSTDAFILGERRLPWWLAGSAAVAGSSNADSPLHQSGKIRRDGLPGAWFYWSQIVNQVWHSLVFSRLLRRAEISTVVELYAIRYSGRAQTWGRVWSMAIASLVEGTLGLALGMLAMIKISTVLLGLHEPVPILGYMVAPEVVIAVSGVMLALSYSTLSGLLGVVAGDMVEFALATACSYILMFIVYREVGYADGLQAGLARLGQEAKLEFTPSFGLSLLVFLLVQPLAMLSGTNTINQRYLAVRDERQAVLSGLWRIVNHYFFRCWPWYVCGLVSVILLTDSAMPREDAYPTLISRYMPPGLRGLMFAGFLVAFMSSVSSNMHAAGSVFVNDFYRPYLCRGRSERHYVRAMRLTMLGFAALATWVALSSDHLLGLLQVLMTVTSAAGLVLLLRWFWWRVNGWADLAAQVLALPVTLLFQHAEKIFGPERDPVAALARVLGGGSADDRYAAMFALAVGTTTVLWLGVMLCTPPEPPEKLAEFYRRVRPYGFWAPVARRCPDMNVTDNFATDMTDYVLGLSMCLGLLFGFGFLLFGRFGVAGLLLGTTAATATWLIRRINARYSVRAGA